MLELGRPWVLFVAAAGALVLLALSRTRPGVPLALPDPGRAPGPPLRWPERAPELLRGGALLALALAAAAPFRAVPSTSRAPASGVAVMLVLDVSESMAEELSAGRSRLEAARREIVRFLATRSGDATGLVTFGREAIVRVPPSLEREALLAALRAGKPGDLGEGTALGTALGLAADRLRAVDAPSRAIILVTDGESNAGALDPLTAARAAGALGARVHVVDVAVDERARTLLAEIARAGGGSHHAVGDEAALDRAYAAIASLEPGPWRGREKGERVPVGVALLWISLALLAVERGFAASRWGALP